MHVLNDVFALTSAPWRFWRLSSGYAAGAPRGSAAFTALTVWRWNAGGNLLTLGADSYTRCMQSANGHILESSSRLPRGRVLHMGDEGAPSDKIQWTALQDRPCSSPARPSHR